MDPEAMKPFGIALLDYYRGDHEATIVMRDDYGQIVSRPVKEFFREPRQYELESVALDLCHGRVLDVGAGTGIHSLYLQQNGFEVCAIDISPEAVSIMKDRGITDVRLSDIMTFEDELFDTMLMMGRGIGIVETLDKLDAFLQHAHTLITTGGQILLTSHDFRDTNDPKYVAFNQRITEAGRYVGEIQMSIEYKDICGPLFNWLHVDTEKLDYYTTKNGWKTTVIKHQPDGNYLAQLIRD